MTIYDVLKQDVQILESLRIPARETELWNAIQSVLQNEQVCIGAMEQAEQRKAMEAEECEDRQAREPDSKEKIEADD